MSTISYCISVCNEAEEFDRLLDQLIPNIDSEDEIIVLVDESKVTQNVSDVIKKWRQIYNFKLIGAPLNGDFSSFKNNFITNAEKQWIFQIDADELLSDALLIGNEEFGNIKAILDMNPTIDLYWIPRENYVNGITREHLMKWGWKQDEKGRINYNDPQSRLFKNNKIIKWKNKIHEVITGHKEYALLPNHYFLIHNKTIQKQEQQNQFYNQL